MNSSPNEEARTSESRNEQMYRSKALGATMDLIGTGSLHPQRSHAGPVSSSRLTGARNTCISTGSSSDASAGYDEIRDPEINPANSN